MAPLRILYVMPLTYIFKVTKTEIWISRKRWELTKKSATVTVIAVDICLRTEPLRTLYSVTLTFIFKGQTFHCYPFAGRFASNRTVSAVELLLFLYNDYLITKPYLIVLRFWLSFFALIKNMQTFTCAGLKILMYVKQSTWFVLICYQSLRWKNVYSLIFEFRITSEFNRLVRDSAKGSETNGIRRKQSDPLLTDEFST